MKCPRCAADNPETDRFCSRCGALLARPEAPAHDPQRAAELIEAAFQFSDRGELNEAISAAEHAVALNPRSTSAHSILGILLYRKGETERAIAEYRIVLALSPESSADRARLEDIMGRPHPPADRRWRIALVGSLAVLLALLLGTIVLLTRQTPSRRATPIAASPPAMGETVTVPPVMPPLPPRPTPRATAVAPPGPPVSTVPPAAERPTVVRAQPPTVIPTLPPVQPGAVVTATPGSEGAPSRARPISVAEREARERFLRSDFEGAIEAYQRTLEELPRAPARVHQDLALTYMRAGRFTEALVEYRTAADGYRQQIARGLDVAEAQHGLAVCERATRALASLP